ncbi:MAG: AraC family transcriptional regulator [Verrucomicrobia bacterium]|nr:AraC family transcriptional regulator [Verrucomicrobiota bacterium]
MIYETYRPRPPLSQFVDWFWFFSDCDVPYHKERMLPDGTFELVIDLKDERRTLFDRHDPARDQHFRRAWLSGTHSKYIVIDVLPGASMIGVHFKPGGIAPCLRLPAGELTDRVVELDAIWNNQAWDLRDALLEQPNPRAKFDVLEAFLLRRLWMARKPPENSRGIAFLLDRLIREPHALKLRQVARELGVSHKHFIEAFRAVVGLTPKRFCRIRRFQEVLQQVEMQQAVQWADLACACGYYDQAHFVHDFRGFSGLSPSAYLTQRGEYLNFVPMTD